MLEMLRMPGMMMRRARECLTEYQVQVLLQVQNRVGEGGPGPGSLTGGVGGYVL